MIPTVIFLKGTADSGRSEWAKQWAAEAYNRVRICRADIIDTISPKFPREKQSIASAACLNLLINAVKTELNVCVDADNLNRLEYQRMESTARRLGADIIWKEFPVTNSASQSDSSPQTDPSEC